MKLFLCSYIVFQKGLLATTKTGPSNYRTELTANTGALAVVDKNAHEAREWAVTELQKLIPPGYQGSIGEVREFDEDSLREALAAIDKSRAIDEYPDLIGN